MNWRDRILDALQLAIVVGLAAIAPASFLGMGKIVWPKRLLGRKTEEVPPVTPADAILFGTAVFAAFSCLMTAVCLFGMGWSEFVRTASISVEAGLCIGVGFGVASYIGNNLQHRRAETRRRRKLGSEDGISSGTRRTAVYVIVGLACSIDGFALCVAFFGLVIGMPVTTFFVAVILVLPSILIGFVAIAQTRHG